MRDIIVGGSGGGGGGGGTTEQADLWTYVRSLEQRFHRMQDEYELRISRLQSEVIELRAQVSASASASYSSEMQSRAY